MNYNFHTHTYHCSHATGTPEEYVLRAIEGGITEMGFSDHFPLRFEDGTENIARVPVRDVPTHLAEIAELKEKYKKKIKIYLGFEMEYYADYFEAMKAKAKEYGAEYLLLGEHYFIPENTPEGRMHTSKPTEDEQRLVRYTDAVIEGMRTGAFTYVAHPDVLNFTKDNNELYKAQARRIAEASLSLGIPLEINFLGIRDHRHYPRELFWQVVAEIGSPVAFGFDAHSADVAYDPQSIKVAKKMVSDLGLNYIGRPVLRPIL